MDKLIGQSATTLAKAIRAKEISSEELVRACIERVSAVNLRLNAVVQLPAEAALAQAREADRALDRGTDHLPRRCRARDLRGVAIRRRL